MQTNYCFNLDYFGQVKTMSSRYSYFVKLLYDIYQIPNIISLRYNKFQGNLFEQLFVSLVREAPVVHATNSLAQEIVVNCLSGSLTG